MIFEGKIEGWTKTGTVATVIVGVALRRCGSVATVSVDAVRLCQLTGVCYVMHRLQVGTLAYMSPERVRGEPYGFASDVWSLGLIALEGAIALTEGRTVA